MSQEPNPSAAQGWFSPNRAAQPLPSAGSSIPRGPLVARSLRARREKGEMRSKTGAYRSGLVMESDGDSKQAHRWNPVKSRISPERLQRFREVYLSNGCNAVRAAIAIGMKPTTAKANAHRFTRALRLQMQEALHAIGVDAVTQAKKLIELVDAKKPWWNRKKKRWDFFPDYAIQLEAVKEINRILNAYPAPRPDIDPITVNIDFGDTKP